jgi:predicted PurR-regulated permease PerM
MSRDGTTGFSAPTWLRDVGFASWLLVGFVLIVVGVIWLLDQTSTIVMPVLLAAVLGAVAGPAVDWMERHRIPRIGGAALVLLGLVAVGVVVFCLVVGGISAQAGEFSGHLGHALDRIQGWLADVGVHDTQSSEDDLRQAVPVIGTTLLRGVATGISGLSSLVFFLALATISTLFVLKDGPVMHRFVNRHLGVPPAVADVVTSNIARSLRSYFLGVTIIAAFNGVVIGLTALLVGVPLAGTIAIVTFVGAYVPYLGAWVAGGFAVLIALGSEGTTAALVLGVAALLANGALQQMIQPFVMGATLGLNPLVVLVVTIGAGALFGMVGLTLAAPLTSAATHISNELRGVEGQPITRPRASSGTAP